MPEGDTLYRVAERLRPVLHERAIVAAQGSWRLPDVGSLVGRRIDAVEARGKHLLIALDDGRSIHSHLGMTGSWHVYLPGAPWSKPARHAGLALATTEHVAVNFSPKLLEVVTGAQLRRNDHLSRLGPDLMTEGFDPAAGLLRFRKRGTLPIGEAVMDQTLVSGIGNIYKSETLFLCQLDPWTRVVEISDESLLQMLNTAHRLMRMNRGGDLRSTRRMGDAHKMWVYGRRGDPCLKCGDTVLMRRQGTLGRSTYWCPTCQPTTKPGHRPGSLGPSSLDTERVLQRRRPPIRGCG